MAVLNGREDGANPFWGAAQRSTGAKPILEGIAWREERGDLSAAVKPLAEGPHSGGLYGGASARGKKGERWFCKPDSRPFFQASSR